MALEIDSVLIATTIAMKHRLVFSLRYINSLNFQHCFLDMIQMQLKLMEWMLELFFWCNLF